MGPFAHVQRGRERERRRGRERLGSGGWELRPAMRVSSVSKRSIIGAALLSLLPSPIVLVVVLVLGLWLEARDSDVERKCRVQRRLFPRLFLADHEKNGVN